MKRKKINHIYSIVSVALVLFLLGFFGTLLLFTRQQLTNQQEQIAMMVEIKENPDSAAMEILRGWLPTADFVREARFVSKIEAADIMRQQLGSEFISPDMPLPFYDAFSVNLKADRLSTDSIAAITQRLQENQAVNDVYLDEGLLGDVAKAVEKLALFAFGVAALFIIVAITLIHSTIRLNLFSDRFLIKNMELVGASWGFISRPYIRKGLRNGFISAILALAGLGSIWILVQKEVPELNGLLHLPEFWIATAGLVLLGVLISWVSTFYVVNKYLKMRLDDLY
jgi:cell division transport system permease protein